LILMEYSGGSAPTKSFNTLTESGDAAFALKKANIFYAGVFLFFSVLMFILQNTGHTWLGKIISTVFTSKNEIGSQLTSRTSFALTLWYLIHAFLTLGTPNLVTSCQFFIHISWLTIHCFILFGIWVACWFIPDGLFTFWLQAARYISFVYIIVQLLFLIDFFHKINKKFTEGESVWLPLTITIVLSAGSLAVLGADYYFFGMSGCGANIAIITINIIFIIVVWLAAMFTERGSILMAAFIAVYVTYLTTMGLFTEGDSQCNKLAGKTNNVWLSIVASIFTLSWCCYSAFSTTYRYKMLDCGFDCCECECECCGEKEEDAKEFSLSFFHIMFAGASTYMSMIVTCWGSSNNDAPWAVDRGIVTKWVNVGASWLCLLIYAWSLAAPYLFPDRVFDDD
jgi:hypothetical protein